MKVVLPLALVDCRVLMLESTVYWTRLHMPRRPALAKSSFCALANHRLGSARCFGLLVLFREKYRTQPGLARWLSANAFRVLELALPFTLRGGLGFGHAHQATTTDRVS